MMYDGAPVFGLMLLPELCGVVPPAVVPPVVLPPPVSTGGNGPSLLGVPGTTIGVSP